MFKNLKAELARNDIDQLKIAEVIGTTSKTVSNKMLGKSEWTRKEMMLIQSNFFPKLTLEYLFATE